MKTYESKTETNTHQVCVRRTCDLCGAVAKDENRWSGYSNEVDETVVTVDVRRTKGFADAGEGFHTETFVDICPTCFETKLVPWLESQGAKVQKKEVDW